MKSRYLFTIIALVIVGVLFISGCVQKETKTQQVSEQVLEKITLNVCQTDPENADYWPTTKVNLFSKAGSISARAKKVGELPPCSSISLDVLQKQTVDGIEFYQVKYNSVIGWQTKRLLVGEKIVENIQEVKKSYSVEQILNARQNYEIVVNDWVSTDWESHYNPNTDKTMNSFWTKIDLSVTNNNQETSLDWITIRVNIKHPAGSDGKDTSWGRLPIDVSDIKSGETKNMIVYYPGDLSQVTIMQDVYITIESDISEDNYRFFKELK